MLSETIIATELQNEAKTFVIFASGAARDFFGARYISSATKKSYR
jgi:hypothetical protein